MTPQETLQLYRKKRRQEEIANVISHAVGLAFATVGFFLIVWLAVIYGDVWHVVSFSVFGTSMVVLYLASTLFHAASKPRLKFYLNKFDHASIFLLIAGSYTPIALTSLRGSIGWVLFGLVWAMAVGGIVFKIWFYKARWRRISALIYIAMGWLIVFAIVPVLKHVPSISIWFLLAGGLAYSSGVLFYLKKQIRFTHLVFHLFVLVGSALHFLAFVYLLPISS